jgi:DNA-binding MarR family transcriptional regulator/GNAT superfamily N-acetyltransferase
MACEPIEQVRSFNRTVTDLSGALNDRYMGRDRPLGARLGLDSGYVSRLLRALQASGLIRVEENPGDRRARILRLTTLGQAGRATLNERSDALAASLLEPLTVSQRARLISAMREVEGLLTAASVRISAVDPEHRDARSCLEQYTAELNRRSSRHFDPTVGATALPDELRPPAGHFFVAYLHGEPIGCGAVKHHAEAPAEIKRMWLAARVRGLGLGRRLLQTLEDCAREGGARIARIETNSDLSEALSLYASADWVEVEPFNDEPFANHWLEKLLVN